MEALREILIAHTGHPRHGAVAQAARDSGIAQSLLSKYMDPDNEVKPPTLEKLARYLKRDYNELLLMVWGKQAKRPRPRPSTPHDQALQSVDLMAAAMIQLRSSLVAMAPSSQPYIVSKKKRSSSNYGEDYLYQTSVLKGHPGFAQKITQLWSWRPARQAA